MSDIALNVLRTFATYDSTSGEFIATWKRHYKSPNIGCPLGYPHTDGYLQIKIKGKPYLVHRLVFAWHYGFWPEQIDHIDGNRINNRIENLREANPTITACNRTALQTQQGCKGVSFHKATGKYMARVRSKGEQLFYKLCLTERDAIMARAEFLANNTHLGFTDRE